MIEEDLHMVHMLYKYIENAMSEAIYEKIDHFTSTLEECKDELLSVLEDWILVGLRFGHPLPVVGSIDLNKELSLIKEPIHESMGTV